MEEKKFNEQEAVKRLQKYELWILILNKLHIICMSGLPYIGIVSYLVIQHWITFLLMCFSISVFIIELVQNIVKRIADDYNDEAMRKKIEEMMNKSGTRKVDSAPGTGTLHHN